MRSERDQAIASWRLPSRLSIVTCTTRLQAQIELACKPHRRSREAASRAPKPGGATGQAAETLPGIPSGRGVSVEDVDETIGRSPNDRCAASDRADVPGRLVVVRSHVGASTPRAQAKRRWKSKRHNTRRRAWADANLATRGHRQRADPRLLGGSARKCCGQLAVASRAWRRGSFATSIRRGLALGATGIVTVRTPAS